MKQLNNPSCLSRPLAMVVALVFGIATFADAQGAYESAVLADHPVGFWPLELNDANATNGIATDLSSNGNNGSYVNIFPGFNNVPGPTANITNGASFDGGTTFVNLGTGGNTALLNFGGRITMEAWVQPAASQVNPWGDIIGKGYDSSQNLDELEMRVSGGNFHAGTYNGGAGDQGVTYGPATTSWTYLVSTWDGTNWNLYVNGSLAATSADIIGALNFSTSWSIGAGSADGSTRMFTGNICEVALYTNALLPAQILAHYFAGNYGTTNPLPAITTQPASRTVYVGANAYFTVSAQGTAPITYQWFQISGGVTNTLSGATSASLVVSNAQLADSGKTYSVRVTNTAGSTNSAAATLTVQTAGAYGTAVMADQPLAYYPLNESSGSTAFEYGGGGLNGSYQNSPALGASGPSGFITSAVTFDGASQFVDLGNAAALNFGGQITMEAWVLPTSPQVNGPIVGFADILAKGSDGSQNNNELKMRLTYGYQGGTYANSAGDVNAVGPATTNWAHLVCTWDGTNWSFYINGQLEGTRPDNVGALNFSDPWAIANGTVNGNGRLFSGNICQAAIYSHALTSANVLAHYLAGLYGTASVPPVIATQPVSTRGITNTTATFTVTAISTAPLSYRWWKGTTPLGETNATLAINNAQLSDAGDYTVVITNIYGAVTSSVANLTVVGPPSGVSLYESTVLNDNPVGYWPLDLSVDTSGSATDLSGNTNSGTYVNISSPGNKVPGPSQYITNGVSFNGTSAFVDLSTGSHTALLNFGGPIAIEAWVQPAPTQTNSLADIFAKGSDTNLFGDELQLRVQNNNAFGGGSTFAGAAASSASAGTNWTYLVSTWDGTKWNLYVNGQLAATNADVTGAFPFADPWAIGNGTAYGNNRFFTGNICQAALYNRALTPTQVSTHYFMGIVGTTNALPVFVQQPASQAVLPGGTVTFSFLASSPYPLTNQWYKDGAPLPNQTNATLVLTNVQINDAGDYSVVIGNSIGTTSSAAAHLVLVTAQPAVITWQTPQAISGASDVSTLGTYFGSWAPYNGGANGFPVNGVAFQGFSDLQGLNDWPNKGGGPYFSSPNTADNNYNTLLPYGQYAPDNTPEVIRWGGMTPGHTYLVQFWVEDARAGATAPRWEALSGGAIGATSSGTDTSAQLAYSNPLDTTPSGNPGSYIIGTFVANTNGSEEILLTPGADGGNASAQVNLFLVRDITALSPVQPHLSGIHLSGTTLVINGNNGTTGKSFTVLTSTNAARPLSQWTSVSTNNFTGSSFSVTNTLSPSAGQGFYILQMQ